MKEVLFCSGGQTVHSDGHFRRDVVQYAAAIEDNGAETQNISDQIQIFRLTIPDLRNYGTQICVAYTAWAEF